MNYRLVTVNVTTSRWRRFHFNDVCGLLQVLFLGGAVAQLRSLDAAVIGFTFRNSVLCNNKQTIASYKQRPV